MLTLLVVGSYSLIAVHGLNGHRERTWSTASGINWLRDFIPARAPNARVLSYGYDARTHGSSSLADQFLYEHAVAFLDKLCFFRRNTKVYIVKVAYHIPVLKLTYSLRPRGDPSSFWRTAWAESW
jgi:hypothetical protein